MRKLQICFLLVPLLFATGCPKYRPKVDFNSKGFAKRVNDFFDVKQREYLAALGTDPAKAKQIRNETLELVLPYIDEAYMDFVTDIQAGRDRGNFVADLIELGTSGAIGITNGERPIQILGVALTAFRGGRRSADLNFYKDQATPILINKMDGNRARVRATIIAREKQEVTDYPVGAAIADIVDYYNAGTLVRAFTELSKDTAAQTQKDEEVLKLQKIDPSRVFDFSVAAQDATLVIGAYRKRYQDIFRGNDTTLQATAKTELVAMYTDIVANAAFKPVLDEIKKDSRLKQIMDELESGNATRIQAVGGIDVFEVVSHVGFQLGPNKMKKPELVVPLKTIYVNRNP